jgi:hypothetical protein
LPRERAPRTTIRPPRRGARRVIGSTSLREKGRLSSTRRQLDAGTTASSRKPP